MTTTSFDDQFTVGTQTIVLHKAYDTVAILRRNVADLEIALRKQTERAGAAEQELAKLRKQEPIKYLYRVTDCFGHDVLRDDPKGATILETIPLFAAPVPAPAVPYGVDEEAANRIALAVYDCKNGINPEPLLYVINRILAAEAHPLSVEGKRALLQSVEVTK